MITPPVILESSEDFTESGGSGGGGGGGEETPPVSSVFAQIIYNGKTISLSRPPYRVYINPYLRRTINRTLTGATETLRYPRISIGVSLSFRPANDTNERMRCDTFWQWAQRGGSFRILVDSTKTVSTTISAAAYGDTILTVADATGITADNLYAIVGGPNYQLVKVLGVSGTSVTISTGLDTPFPSGSVFRDWLLWDGLVQDSEARTPINELIATHQRGSFDWTLDFTEATP